MADPGAGADSIGEEAYVIPAVAHPLLGAVTVQPVLGRSNVVRNPDVPDRQDGQDRPLCRRSGGSPGRQASTIGRSEETRARVFEQRSLDAADQIVSVHDSMKGAAMKLGVMMSVIDLGIVPEHAPRRRPTEAGCAA